MTVDMEFEGKTMDIAAEEACKKLNIKREDLQYDVLSYGSTGIFGLVGSKKARIRVQVPQDGISETDKDANGQIADSTDHLLPEKEEFAKETVPESHSEEIVDFSRQSLQKIIDAISGDATISVEKNSDCIQFNVHGGNAAVLIGKRGQTLEAIQYIVEKIANKRNDQKVRIQVDVEGYLKARHDNLEKLAIRLAEKVVRTGKPMTIGQMNAHDRRIVHLALKSNNGVRTQSMGNGLYRKLMIYPKKRVRERKQSTHLG